MPNWLKSTLTSLAFGVTGSALLWLIQGGIPDTYETLPRIIFITLFLVILCILLSYTQNKFIYPHKGEIPYNLNVNSTELSIPTLYEKYKNSVLLVGPSQNYVLNHHRYPENFEKLINSLSLSKKINILISDITDEKVIQMYQGVSNGKFEREAKEIIHSIKRIDSFIVEKFGQDKLTEIKDNKLLEIRCANGWLDSFCFIDEKTNNGQCYFMLVTQGVPGGGRPVYYFDETDHQDIFNFYHDKYRNNTYHEAKRIWPA
ncbi:hypothetical protein HG263_01610 [Pseudoalteromonas sp. JBTF-M23]|uniref:Uncharacterized protein n=1 Tax=Pseudoalteromonas caenipelagi TaxID=2726988 RepID=A0A849V900_9GAMM|nr:hypothetical protein [Pseudoalteromonas caenipelagi]NOU49250.1 hypothetical protein [Pseudoalteromonas caenipelagi]